MAADWDKHWRCQTAVCQPSDFKCGASFGIQTRSVGFCSVLLLTLMPSACVGGMYPARILHQCMLKGCRLTKWLLVIVFRSVSNDTKVRCLSGSRSSL